MLFKEEDSSAASTAATKRNPFQCRPGKNNCLQDSQTSPAFTGATTEIYKLR